MLRFLRFVAAVVAIAALTAFSWAPAEAYILTFDGNICNGGSCSNWGSIDQSYGDLPGVLDVIYTSREGNGDAEVRFSNLRWWNSYGGLPAVAFAGSYDSDVGEIALIPAPGYQVRLNGFDLGAYYNDMSTQENVYGNGYQVLQSSGPIALSGSRHFDIGLTSANGLIIQWGPSGYNVAIDNVDFSVEAAPVPIAPTVLLIAPALFGLAAVRFKWRKHR